MPAAPITSSHIVFAKTFLERGIDVDQVAQMLASADAAETEATNLRAAIKGAYFEGLQDGREGWCNENTEDRPDEMLWEFSGAKATATKET